jgi:16S rRNA (cytosine967-C5)-methyltransferase
LTGWKTRLLAIKILNLFEKDKKLKEHIERLTKELSPLDRAFVREISSGTVRNLRLLDFIVEKATSKKLKKQKTFVRNGLRLITYQLFFTGVPEYAAINETVEVIKKLLGKKVAGFVNAVSKKLLNFDYKKEVFSIKDELERISTLYSFETWMVRRWKKFYESELEELLESLNKVAPLFLRVNRIKVSPEKFFNLLTSSGIEAEFHPLFRDLIRIKGRVVIEDIPGYEEGFFYIQDPASFLSAYLLEPKEGELVLDVGAAPGGKTTAISSLTMDRARVIAVDVSKERMELLKRNIEKLGIRNVEPIVTDIRKDRKFLERFKNSFDKILVDAPCSGTGVIRRHPEGKWNKSLSLIRSNQKIQKELLKVCYELLKPGGILVYSTCSLEKEEGEDVFSFALKIGFKELVPSNLPQKLQNRVKNSYFRVFPHKDNMDGFFYAKFSTVL